MPTHPSGLVAGTLLSDAHRRAAAYLNAVGDRPVAPDAEALAGLARFREPLPETPSDPAETLALLDEAGSPATVATAGKRFFGFVTGGALPASVAAQWLAAAWDQNGALRIMSPVATYLEDVVLEWVRELLALPEGTGGALVTCATMANFTALAAARHRVLNQAGWNVEDDGLFGAPPVTVILGEEAHVSVYKSLSMLGLGRKRLIRVPADGQGRMRADALPPISGPTIVILQAGNVNTGAFDPAREIVPIVKASGAWVHVDGAFGIWAAASPGYRHLMEGYSLADSWATDAHKWPNVNYDSGIALVRDTKALRAAMTFSAAYLVDSEFREPSHHTPESSRRARGIELWAALRSLGRSGVADLVDRTCRFARRFAEELSAAGYRILNEVVINQVMVSFGSAERTLATIAAIQRDGICWCGGSAWQGTTVMRISVSSWATADEDVERSIAAILSAAEGTKGL